MSYFYVGSEESPVLVKWNDKCSYLPIFEKESQAAAWAATLEAGGEQKMVRQFSFAVACAARARMKASGHMVFVLPACPEEFK